MAHHVVITGATGAIATATLAALKGSSLELRGVTRDEKKGAKLKEAGVEPVVADLEQPWTLGEVFTGADTAFIIVPAGPRAPEQTSNALWAARQAGVKHVVRLSAIGAAHDAPTINSRLHALSDAELERSGIAYTILKPHFFLQNLLMTAPTIKKDGAFYMPLSTGKMPGIDTRDVGEFAAKVLTSGGHEGKTYTITGPAAFDMNGFAAAVGRAIGKQVKYVDVPLEAGMKAMAEMGMDPFMVNMMRDYMRAYAQSWKSEVTDTFQKVVGKPARSVDDFARDFAMAFK